MSDTNNPFAATDKKTGSPFEGKTVAWSAAALATIAALVFLILWVQNRNSHQHEAKALRTRLEKTSADLAAALATGRTNQEYVAILTNKIAEMQREHELAGHMAKNLEEEMRQQLESKDVTISKLQGKLTVNIVDRIMFDSGEAILKPDGAAVMQKIADLLQTHPELKIHVIGHTDNVPIRQTAQSRFASNWELSASRALAAVHFLTEKAGVDPRRLGAVGYGEFRPIADNTTPEGRAKNRRIAITILSDEMAAADTVPAVSQPATTNAVPATAVEPAAK